MPKSNQNHLPKKHNIFVRDMNNFDRADFIMDILGIDWASVVCEGDANNSFNHLLDSVNKVVDKHMPLKRLTNKEFDQIENSLDIMNFINIQCPRNTV